MPNPLDLLKMLNPMGGQELSPEQRAAADAQTEQDQANQGGWQQAARRGINGAVDFAKGVTGVGNQGPAGMTMTNAGQLLGAGVGMLNPSSLLESLRGAVPAAEAHEFFTPANYAADNALTRASGGTVAHGANDAAHELQKSDAFKQLQSTITQHAPAGPGMLSPQEAQATSRSAADVFNPGTARQMNSMYEQANPAFKSLQDSGMFSGDRSVGGLYKPQGSPEMKVMNTPESNALFGNTLNDPLYDQKVAAKMAPKQGPMFPEFSQAPGSDLSPAPSWLGPNAQMGAPVQGSSGPNAVEQAYKALLARGGR